MNDKFNDFPQYRMLSGRKVYYKITSNRSFEEVSWIGQKKQVFTMSASQYPEILLISDMLNCVEPYRVMPAELESLFDL